MKNNFYKTATAIFLQVLFMNLAMAQSPVIANTDHPLAGHTYSYQGTTTATQADYFNSGANATWDFSSIIDTLPPLVLTCMNASSTPYASTFPTANLAYHTNTYDSARLYFYNASNNAYTNLGSLLPDVDPMFADTSFNVAGSDEIHYPFTINDNYLSTYTTWDHFNGSVIPYGDSTWVMADGYGTLILPNHTFTNALRVRQNIKFEIFSGTWWNEVLYFFYVPGQPGYVCSYGFFADASFTPVSTTSSPQYLSNINTGIANTNSNTHFSLVTNTPAKQFQIFCGNEFIGKTVEVKNILGQTVNTTQIITSLQTIDLSNISAGNYLLCVMDVAKPVVEKIIVQ